MAYNWPRGSVVNQSQRTVCENWTLKVAKFMKRRRKSLNSHYCNLSSSPINRRSLSPFVMRSEKWNTDSNSSPHCALVCPFCVFCVSTTSWFLNKLNLYEYFRDTEPANSRIDNVRWLVVDGHVTCTAKRTPVKFWNETRKMWESRLVVPHEPYRLNYTQFTK